jgi:hypothetical protein
MTSYLSKSCITQLEKIYNLIIKPNKIKYSDNGVKLKINIDHPVDEDQLLIAINILKDITNNNIEETWLEKITNLKNWYYDDYYKPAKLCSRMTLKHEIIITPLEDLDLLFNKLEFVEHLNNQLEIFKSANNINYFNKTFITRESYLDTNIENAIIYASFYKDNREIKIQIYRSKICKFNGVDIDLPLDSILN